MSKLVLVDCGDQRHRRQHRRGSTEGYQAETMPASLECQPRKAAAYAGERRDQQIAPLFTSALEPPRAACSTGPDHSPHPCGRIARGLQLPGASAGTPKGGAIYIEARQPRRGNSATSAASLF